MVSDYIHHLLGDFFDPPIYWQIKILCKLCGNIKCMYIYIIATAVATYRRPCSYVAGLCSMHHKVTAQQWLQLYMIS